MTAEGDGRDELDDAQVTRTYRELSNECTPPELDRAVLNEAASRADPGRGGRRTRFARLAFAATLVLGVALLFEMQSETGFVTPETSDRADGRSVRDAPASSKAGSDDARQSLQDFTSAVAESAAGLSRVGERAASEADGGTRCSDEQTTDAATWWRCVEALRSEGNTVAADQELKRLHERFPDFKPDPQASVLCGRQC